MGHVYIGNFYSSKIFLMASCFGGATAVSVPTAMRAVLCKLFQVFSAAGSIVVGYSLAFFFKAILNCCHNLPLIWTLLFRALVSRHCPFKD